MAYVYGDNRKIEFTQDEINELSLLLGLKIFEEKKILERLEIILQLEEVCENNPTYVETRNKIQRLEKLQDKLHGIGEYFEGE